MLRFCQHYLSYRSVGIDRAAAVRFAWIATVSGVALVPLRSVRR